MGLSFWLLGGKHRSKCVCVGECILFIEYPLFQIPIRKIQHLHRWVFKNIIPERGVIAASLQWCLASLCVLFLSCAPCLVLINTLLKRVKRSSWFTLAKTRGHLMELDSINNIFSKPPSNHKPWVLEWNVFETWRHKKYQSLSTPPHTKLSHLTVQLGRVRRTEPRLRCNFHTTLSSTCP